MGRLVRRAEGFVAYYYDERFHESIDNVTPASVCIGRQYEIITERDRIKKRTNAKEKEGIPGSEGSLG